MFFKMVYGSLNLIALVLKKIQKQKMFFGSSFSFLMVLSLLFLVINVYGVQPATNQRITITNSTTYDWSNFLTVSNLVYAGNGNGGWFNVTSNLTINATNGRLLATGNAAGSTAANSGGVFHFGGGGTSNINIGSMTMISNTAKGYGGAISIQGANTAVTFRGEYAYFEKNQANNDANGRGGAIFVGEGGAENTAPRAIFNVTTMVFINNSASQDGGSIAVYFKGYMEINSKYMYISNNSANIGTVYANDATIVFNGVNMLAENNYAITKGGVMYLATQGKMTVKGSTLNFINNATSAGIPTNNDDGGGGIYFGGVGNLLFEDSVINFIHNVSSRIGGGIGTVNDTRERAIDFKRTDMNFTSNTAAMGAAIGIRGANTTLTIDGGNIVFINNISSAPISQGNISLESGAKMTLKNIKSMTGIGNKAASGGFLFLPSLPFDFAGDKMEMTGNEAFGIPTGGGTGGYGFGGVFLFSGNGAKVTFAGTTMTFTGNKAKYGAVLYATRNADITFSGNSKGGYLTFSGNVTSEGRGVISWDNQAVVKFLGLDSFIAKWNKAVGGGFLDINGANYTLGSNLIIITSNTATASGSGGGIYLTNSAVTFDGKASGAVSRLEISTNAAGASGGGMYLTGSKATFVMTTMTFSANTAATSGGGMYFLNKSTAEFTSYLMEFKGNKANNGSGGAIYYTASRAIFSPTMMIFSGNTATGSGGGMYFTQSTASFTQASVSKPFLEMTFIGNKSGATGGAMYFQNSTATFAANDLMRFANNQAYTDGGAMYFTVANTIFSKAAKYEF